MKRLLFFLILCSLNLQIFTFPTKISSLSPTQLFLGSCVTLGIFIGLYQFRQRVKKNNLKPNAEKKLSRTEEWDIAQQWVIQELKYNIQRIKNSNFQDFMHNGPELTYFWIQNGFTKANNPNFFVRLQELKDNKWPQTTYHVCTNFKIHIVAWDDNNNKIKNHVFSNLQVDTCIALDKLPRCGCCENKTLTTNQPATIYDITK